MRNSRLPWLLLVVAALLLLRWLAPLRPSTELAVVAPSGSAESVLDRNAQPSAWVPPLTQTNREAQASAVPPAPAVPLEPSAIGNAFAPRRAIASIDAAVAQAPSVSPAPAPVPEEPPAPPPPPPEPPPMQVIGTWDDGASPGVFIATPQSTVLARKDTVLMADYKVVAVTRQAVSLIQLSSKQPWTLPVPQNAPPARSASAPSAKPTSNPPSP